ncbi:hypothetical protein VNO77_19486 [Canavalia gladiata]|uniref:Uncharacterized protein n=1 Tax=Canavalia gladiata TaxID=3824 RepID=A0AAN9QKJ5_CANGL
MSPSKRNRASLLTRLHACTTYLVNDRNHRIFYGQPRPVQETFFKIEQMKVELYLYSSTDENSNGNPGPLGYGGLLRDAIYHILPVTRNEASHTASKPLHYSIVMRLIINMLHSSRKSRI